VFRSAEREFDFINLKGNRTLSDKAIKSLLNVNEVVGGEGEGEGGGGGEGEGGGKVKIRLVDMSECSFTSRGAAIIANALVKDGMDEEEEEEKDEERFEVERNRVKTNSNSNSEAHHQNKKQNKNLMTT